jgi:azurin
MRSALSRLSLAAVLGFAFAGVASAKTCELSIDGNDMMQFSTKEMTVAKDCTDVKVTLKHTGKLAKEVMGHNWVLVAEGDYDALIKGSGAAGVANDYVAKDAKVVAHTKVIGGGQSDSVTFKKSDLKAGTNYKYVCTFPGHFGVMNGVLKVEG